MFKSLLGFKHLLSLSVALVCYPFLQNLSFFKALPYSSPYKRIRYLQVYLPSRISDTSQELFISIDYVGN